MPGLSWDPGIMCWESRNPGIRTKNRDPLGVPKDPPEYFSRFEWDRCPSLFRHSKQFDHLVIGYSEFDCGYFWKDIENNSLCVVLLITTYPLSLSMSMATDWIVGSATRTLGGFISVNSRAVAIIDTKQTSANGRIPEIQCTKWSFILSG